MPTPEHFLPLLYARSLQEKDDTPTRFIDQPLAGSITMTSVRISYPLSQNLKLNYSNACPTCRKNVSLQSI